MQIVNITKVNKQNNKQVMNEKELIEKVKKGENGAFNTLFKKYNEYSYKISFHILKNQDDALDNVNNAWIKIYQALLKNQFNYKSKFSTWIYKIILNEALMFLKSKKSSISLDDIVNKKGIDSVYNKSIINFEDKIFKNIHIEKVIKELSPIQQEIVKLLMDGYKFPEISKILEIKPNYLYQITSRLKKNIEDL